MQRGMQSPEQKPASTQLPSGMCHSYHRLCSISATWILANASKANLNIDSFTGYEFSSIAGAVVCCMIPMPRAGCLAPRAVGACRNCAELASQEVSILPTSSQQGQSGAELCSTSLQSERNAAVCTDKRKLGECHLLLLARLLQGSYLQ